MNPAEIQSIKQRFGIIGNSPLLNHAIQIAIQVAPTKMSILITGESGSGKESFSKIIHSLSQRKHGQFIAINCGAIPEGTIYSELFGHEKGAFTGATEARKGFFEVTNDGTIFLDEIGELPEQAQAMLLRVLENGEFIRMGSVKAQKTDVRVIAATNVHLERAIQEGKFREDLYFRLNNVPIFVPPLRERGNDLLLLFRKFATDFAENYNVRPIRLSPDSQEILLKFPFPGNIRQLRNLANQLSVLEPEKEITPEILQKYLPQQIRETTPVLFSEKNGNTQDLTDREILYKVLFDLRNDVTDLKKIVYQLMRNGSVNNEFMEEHEDLFNNIQKEYSSPTPTNAKAFLPVKSNENEGVINIQPTVQEDLENTQDIQHEEEDENLSLEEKEKELILKALKKHNNKRKYAAKELGISERTLYRKIKIYSIDA